MRMEWNEVLDTHQTWANVSVTLKCVLWKTRKCDVWGVLFTVRGGTKVLSTSTKRGWRRWGSWHRACKWGRDRKETDKRNVQQRHGKRDGNECREMRNTDSFLPWAIAVCPRWTCAVLYELRTVICPREKCASARVRVGVVFYTPQGTEKLGKRKKDVGDEWKNESKFKNGKIQKQIQKRKQKTSKSTKNVQSLNNTSKNNEKVKRRFVNTWQENENYGKNA